MAFRFSSCLWLAILTIPVSLKAACEDVDALYEKAVSAGDYAAALARVSDDLHIPATERSRFQIDLELAQRIPDLHGQSDPVKMEAHLAPELFQEGKLGACEGVAHEWSHLRHFASDREQLHKGLPNTDGSREQDAYENLEDNDLLPHAAAHEIEAVLAQTETSRQSPREEDRDYLIENLEKLYSSRKILADHTNEDYYLPAIKDEDKRSFCRGAAYLKGQGFSPNLEWDRVCAKGAGSLEK
jgi:hypothetical protein